MATQLKSVYQFDIGEVYTDRLDNLLGRGILIHENNSINVVGYGVFYSVLGTATYQMKATDVVGLCYQNSSLSAVVYSNVKQSFNYLFGYYSPLNKKFLDINPYNARIRL